MFATHPVSGSQRCACCTVASTSRRSKFSPSICCSLCCPIMRCTMEKYAGWPHTVLASTRRKEHHEHGNAPHHHDRARRHAPGLAFEPSGSCSFNDRSCVSCGDTNNGEVSHRRCVLSHCTYVCQLLEFLKRADGVALNRDQVIHERQLAIRARKHAHVGKWYPAPVS